MLDNPYIQDANLTNFAKRHGTTDYAHKNTAPKTGGIFVCDPYIGK